MTRILLTSYGWEDAGGGTRVPRNLARELCRRAHHVTVFHAGVEVLDDAAAYAVRAWDDEDGIHLVGVYNRPHRMLDLEQPLREIDDAAITAAFAATLDRDTPDVVHFHNLHNLGAALIDETRARGIPSFFTTHNHWLVCPRAYLVTGTGALCDGAADDGRSCAACVGTPARTADFRRRRSEVRDRFTLGVEACLAVSGAVAHTLVGGGYERDQVTVERQAMPEPEALWSAVGSARRPGRVGEELVVAFVGSVYSFKGPHVLVEAAQSLPSGVVVRLHGDISPGTREWLRVGDATGRVELAGAFETSDLPAILASIDIAVVPSVIQDCAPLVVAECHAARVPVVGARIGGIPELVRDGIDGLLFEPGDAAALAAALGRLACEPGLLERLQRGIVPPTRFAAFVDRLEEAYAGSVLPVPAAATGTRGSGAVKGGRGRNLLAAPAWLGVDRLPELLASWKATFEPDDDVALILVADAEGAVDVAEIGGRIEALVGDAEVADIVLLEVSAGEALALAGSCDGVVSLHRGAPGLLRRAAAAGRPIVTPDRDGLRAWAA